MPPEIVRTRKRWKGMKQRCYNPAKKDQLWQRKGITVCGRWLESFDNFLTDMGPCPSDDHSLDRIENDKNYEPSNCRWATRKEQARNKSTNRLIDGKPMVQVSEETGISVDTLCWRLKQGKTGAELLSTERLKGKTGKRGRLSKEQVIEIRERVLSNKESYSAIGRDYQLTHSVIRNIALGISYKDF